MFHFMSVSKTKEAKRIMFVFVGGGVLELNIDHTLTVDGYIKANSENVQGVTSWYSASGGSGGSIHITTVNYTGQGSLNISDYCICIIIETEINSMVFFFIQIFSENHF